MSTVNKPERVWSGPYPTNCQICNEPISTSFVDGKTRFGPWAVMCLACHENGYGCGLGTGRGQRYELRSSDAKFVKVEG